MSGAGRTEGNHGEEGLAYESGADIAASANERLKELKPDPFSSFPAERLPLL